MWENTVSKIRMFLFFALKNIFIDYGDVKTLGGWFSKQNKR